MASEVFGMFAASASFAFGSAEEFAAPPLSNLALALTTSSFMSSPAFGARTEDRKGSCGGVDPKNREVSGWVGWEVSTGADVGTVGRRKDCALDLCARQRWEGWVGCVV